MKGTRDIRNEISKLDDEIDARIIKLEAMVAAINEEISALHELRQLRMFKKVILNKFESSEKEEPFRTRQTG